MNVLEKKNWSSWKEDLLTYFTGDAESAKERRNMRASRLSAKQRKWRKACARMQKLSRRANR